MSEAMGIIAAAKAKKGGGGKNVAKNIMINAVRASGAWGGTDTITMGAVTMHIAPNQRLDRFSHYWTGENASTYPYGLWQWITDVTNSGVYYNLVNNDGEPDCIKVGDVAKIADTGSAWVGTEFENTEVWAQIIGIDNYMGFGSVAEGYHIDWRFVCPWTTPNGINKVDNNNAIYHNTCTFTGDGTTTTFYFQDVGGYIADVNSVTVNGSSVSKSNYTIDYENGYIQFNTAPAADATIVVMNKGSKNPWLTSDAYAFLNGTHVASPGSTTFSTTAAEKSYYDTDPKSPAVGAENYYFSGAVKTKQLRLGERWSDTELVTDATDTSYANLGKFWIPTEFEYYGSNIMGGNYYSINGCNVHYPIFNSVYERLYQTVGDNSLNVWLLAPRVEYTTSWCMLNRRGYGSSMNTHKPEVKVPVCFRTGTTFTVNPNWG